MDKFSYLSNGHTAAIDDLYNQYTSNPNSIEKDWQKFFEGFEFARTNFSELPSSLGSSSLTVPENIKKEFAVLNLINLYRSSGHLYTETNPVRKRMQYTPTLDDIHLIGLSENDMETVFEAGNEIGLGPRKLKDIISFLKITYCRTVGVEYKYIRNGKVSDWLQSKMESCQNLPNLTLDEKKHLLNKISKAVLFENFLHTKFVGQKRFSLEGAEALIPALQAVIEKGASLGLEEFVIGMAHRGRLNVLANIMNKTYEDIFNEFEGKEYELALFDGDVKYHLGYSTNIITKEGKKIHLSLTPNPSHLETVASVVQGISRAKIDNVYKGDFSKLAPIIIHGDAAVAGQGIVYELIQMSKLDGYKTGGTIHLVINNQIGFTTNYLDARSSTYCTDIAKVVLSPVFHVNGDDVEGLVYAIKLAMEFRQKFERDVFIDLLCYRKYGHNEGDEPRFTQPLLYKAIEKHPNPREIYLKKLISEGVVTDAEAKEIDKEFKSTLQDRLDFAKQIRKTKITSFLEGVWKGIKVTDEKDFEESIDTSVNAELFKELVAKTSTLPKDKHFFVKILKLFKERAEMNNTNSYDWATGELMAYATLLLEGHAVRLSGQDVERGTFSHRHEVVKMDESEEEYIPLSNLSNTQAPFYVYNSLLSEYGVLGFDYGYAMASPNTLTIWEAQFGDFNNGAQIIIDQYLSSAEDKWRRMNGICLFLPHGYEGQGSEHSSARMERFLVLCAEYNMYVVNITTPANFFHVLRRQLKNNFRKPLIAFTPKSLLRHPKCVSKLEEFSSQKFKEVIDDTFIISKDVKRILFCTGKIYYDLNDYRILNKINNVAIVRIEQLYPFPLNQVNKLFEKYSKATEFTWVQEEPENMGAWPYLHRTLKSIKLNVIAREESASPATGSPKMHAAQQKSIVENSFDNL
jgi:2-oxoglutarate dehydrogenase E1 component